MTNSQKRVGPVVFDQNRRYGRKRAFQKPKFSFLPDLSKIQKVPRVISILVDVFPFFDI